jgi:hypothetical protein
MDFKIIKILLNICGIRDDTHKLLIDRPNRIIILTANDFFNKNNFIALFCRVFVI